MNRPTVKVPQNIDAAFAPAAAPVPQRTLLTLAKQCSQNILIASIKMLRSNFNVHTCAECCTNV